MLGLSIARFDRIVRIMRFPKTLSDSYVVMRPCGSFNGRSTYVVRDLRTMEDYEAFVYLGLGGAVILRSIEGAR